MTTAHLRLLRCPEQPVNLVPCYWMDRTLEQEANSHLLPRGPQVDQSYLSLSASSAKSRKHQALLCLVKRPPSPAAPRDKRQESNSTAVAAIDDMGSPRETRIYPRQGQRRKRKDEQVKTVFRQMFPTASTL